MAEISSEDLAYTAGIIDGEGCISFKRERSKHGNRHWHFRPVISVATTDNILTNFLASRYDSFTKRRKEFANKNWKPQNVVIIQSMKRVQRFLLKILPYLKLKKPQAELAMKFIELRQSKDNHHVKNGETSFGQEEWDIYWQVRKLNGTVKESD